MGAAEAALARLLPFLVTLGVLLAAEATIRARPFAGWRHWSGNLALGGFNAALMALAPFAPVAVALQGERHGIGLATLVPLPGIVEAALLLPMLDMAVYWQHRLLHRIGWLWSLHRWHHADPAVDVTTGVRFHTGEIVLSALWKSTVVLALGVPAAAVLLFETLLALAALVGHSNIRLPNRLDLWLRWLMVTPAYHLVHHGAQGDDMHHNFSFALSVWDRLFGSYRARMTSSHIGLTKEVERA